MQKTKKLFERISLDEVRQIIRDGQNRERESNRESDTLDNAPRVPSQNLVIMKRTKHHAAPTPSATAEGDGYPLGLWMDKDMFRRHQRRQPRIVLHHRQASTNNRYLALADLALNTQRQRTSQNGKNDLRAR